jgi:carbonic anhydrase/acetyltransferase-like protein (isoleucine patch superfamily)
MLLNSKQRSNSYSSLQIISFEGKSPQFDETVFIDPGARLIGEIILGSRVSIWPFVLLRADSNRIVVGDQSPILDKVLIESPKDHPVVIERKVLISHGVILHGCIIREGAVVGIGAIVLDGAEVGRNSIGGSGSLVPPGMEIPDRSLVLGIPAKAVKRLDKLDLGRSKEQLAEAYEKSRKYLKIFNRQGT